MKILTKQLTYFGIFCLAILSSLALAEINVERIEAAPAEDPRVGGAFAEKAIEVPEPDDSGEENDKTSLSAEAPDVIEFINGDKLHGTLLSVKPSDYGLRWEHASADEPIEFTLESISTVELGGKKESQQNRNNLRVKLTNSDVLTGELVALDNEQLALDTWYAGRMGIKRPMVKTLNPNVSSSTTVYEGPTDIDNWEIANSNTQTWKLKKGALYSSQSNPIGRNIDNMPAMANIQFEAAWQDSDPVFYFAFYSDNLQSYSSNCYSLQIRGSSVYMYQYSTQSGRDMGGNANVTQFRQKKDAKFNILADSKSQRFTLLIDGQMIKQWNATQPAGNTGNGIVFFPQNRPIKISNISISKWDGEIPQAESSSETEVKEDIIEFVNEDKVSGNLLSIADENAELETSYATLDIPLKRIVKVQMSSEAAQRARRNKNDVRAHFAKTGVVTMELKSIKDNTVNGSSENFGPVKMPLEAFDRLEFNIYEDKSKEEDDGYSF